LAAVFSRAILMLSSIGQTNDGQAGELN